MKILVLNAGSSSQKSCLYNLPGALDASDIPEPIWAASVDWTHRQGMAEITVETQSNPIFKETLPATDRAGAIAHLLATLWQGSTQVIQSPTDIDIVGHRVVHGGAEYRESVRITPQVKAAIAQLAAFAPVHNPVNLEGIEAVETILGQVPQVAVFDTAFHSTLPPVAYVYPGPYEWLEQGIRRYGFHGISHRYVAHQTAQLMGCDLQELRLITCHLGNGCSLAAIRGGQSIETTMGFTPLDGLMMGSRSGSVDPGILIHLLRQGQTADQLDSLLNKQSGLLGISGVSNDLRLILQAIEEGNARAQLAFDLFIHHLCASISAMLPSLGGLDAIAFTAGIGENSPIVWNRVCEALSFLGIKLEERQLKRSPDDQEISASNSAVRIFVVHTKEDWAIAQECLRQFPPEAR